MDAIGRVVLPKPLRGSLGPRPGSKVDICRYGEGLTLVPGSGSGQRGWGQGRDREDPGPRVSIAHESGRAIHAHRLLDELAMSAVTLAELEVGVLVAIDSTTRALRLARWIRPGAWSCWGGGQGRADTTGPHHPGEVVP